MPEPEPEPEPELEPEPVRVTLSLADMEAVGFTPLWEAMEAMDLSDTDLLSGMFTSQQEAPSPEDEEVPPAEPLEQQVFRARVEASAPDALPHRRGVALPPQRRPAARAPVALGAGRPRGHRLTHRAAVSRDVLGHRPRLLPRQRSAAAVPRLRRAAAG